ncbi:progestin and adipoQ receptor family member 3b isoform X2 [Puntigrus tetrazona]|uniref:progestin and adipoQ receptor family member 3b isoform X2 n=1 Tax=Puntigrus tetrazona TaxID=1606681 RepID=UPI001C894082|nr:progestin and adipoQ receptor family member 3b isoform X2 [Puntigrus tetrazona]
MPQNILKSTHYIELGSYQYWPVLVPRGIRLYTYEQIPVFLKENPYITDGYRAHLPSKLCLKSIFILSNESVNIWSHLLGFLLFFSLGVNDMATVLPSAGASREDYVIYSIGLFCFQVCMLCSVGYHLFCCHRSEKTCRRWLALDYAGISVGILGCYVPGVFYAFYCNSMRVVPLSVLEAGVPADGAGSHPGRVRGSDSSALPHAAVEEAALGHVLLGGRVRHHPGLPLGLAQRRIPLRNREGVFSSSHGHVSDCRLGVPVLRQ